jgi:hypothetical protein
MSVQINYPVRVTTFDLNGRLLEVVVYDDELDLVTGLESFDSEEPEEGVSHVVRDGTGRRIVLRVDITHRDGVLFVGPHPASE